MQGCLEGGRKLSETAVLEMTGGMSSPRFSPDGMRLAYTDGGAIVVRDLAAVTTCVRLGEGRAPSWRCDGATVGALRDARVWLYSLEGGGGGYAVTPDRLNVAHFAWSPDGQRIALLERVSLGTAGGVWVVEVGSGRLARVCGVSPAEETPVGRLSWSPDGRHLAWEAMVCAEDRTNNVFEVRLLALESGRLERVVPVGSCQTRLPSWRPDGKVLAFLASPHAYGFQSLYGLAVWNVGGGAVRYLWCDPVVASNCVWAPDARTIYLSGRCLGIASQIFSVDSITGRREQLTADLANHEAPVVSPDGRWIACERTAPDRLPGIQVISTDGTSVSPDISHALSGRRPEGVGVPELVRWKSADGLELEGLLLRPAGCKPGVRPLPLVVDTHGGPLGSPPLRLDGHPLGIAGLHDIAAQGCAVLSAEYRRSGNFGWAMLERSIQNADLIGMDATDILTGVDELVAAGVADAGRLGLHGFSHGGFLTNWLVTQTGRFRAAVSVDGFCDQMTRAIPDTILEVWLGGTAEDVPRRYRRCSPLTFAPQARTPTLLIHGRNSVLWSQGEAFRDSLVRAGVEVELVALDEDHWPSARSSNEVVLLRTREWFARYLNLRR